MANVHLDSKEPIKASAYFINLIAYGSDKEKLLGHLKNTLKYSEETIKKRLRITTNNART